MKTKRALTSILNSLVTFAAAVTIAFTSEPMQAAARPDARKSARTLSDLVVASVRLVAEEQKAKADRVYVAGEWPSQIESTLMPIAAGVGRPIGTDEEASAFTTATVMNQLALIYLENPHLRARAEISQIPELLTRGAASLERYQEGELYNFYPPRLWQGVMVRQPADMTLARIWKGFTNIPEDADTTSVVYTAKLNVARVTGAAAHVPTAVYGSFAKHRDLNREPHFYNKDLKQKNTGAFMTWQMDEFDPKMPRFPFSDPKAGVRIPFNVNDVDCIVNLNVLRMLTLDDRTEAEGSDAACRYINQVIRRGQQATCGIYYPNTYHIAYSAALLENAGSSCLEPDSKAHTIRAILKNQSADGGWDNLGNIWNDSIHATAYAMAALMEFGDAREPGTYAALVSGASFLIHEMKTTKHGLPYWRAEGFFTATALARSLVMWRSTAYTTALVASVLAKIELLIPEKSLEDYHRIGRSLWLPPSFAAAVSP